MNDSFFKFSIENDRNKTQKALTLVYRRNVPKRYVEKVARATKTQALTLRFSHAFFNKSAPSGKSPLPDSH